MIKNYKKSIVTLAVVLLTASAHAGMKVKDAPKMVSAPTEVKAKPISGDSKMIPSSVKAVEIRVVDLYKIVSQLDESKEIEAGLRQEDDAKRKQLETMAMEAKKIQDEITNGGSMLKTDALEAKRERIIEIQKSVELKAQTYEQSRQRRAQEIQMQLYKTIEEVVEQIRSEMHLDVIFAGSVLAVNPALDITSLVVERMNKTYTAKKTAPASSKTADNKPSAASTK